MHSHKAALSPVYTVPKHLPLGSPVLEHSCKILNDSCQHYVTYVTFVTYVISIMYITSATVIIIIQYLPAESVSFPTCFHILLFHQIVYLGTAALMLDYNKFLNFQLHHTAVNSTQVILRDKNTEKSLIFT